MRLGYCCLFVCCVAVRCAVVVFEDSVMVCILHSVIFPPLCSVLCSEFCYHHYVRNSMLSGSALFCVVLFCVFCNVLFCICAVYSVVLGVDMLWLCCSGLFRYVLLWYAAC